VKDAEEKAKRAIQLIKLAPSPELIEHIKRVLGFLESFADIDLEGVEPMLSPMDCETPLREDKAGKPIPRSSALRDAPDTQAGFFRGPKP